MVTVRAAISEHATQAHIRNALASETDALIFRANVGRAWASNDARKLPDGSLLLRNPRPFSTGLPAGFADLFGFVPVTITADMVGHTLAVFVAVECKSSTGKPRANQTRFVDAVSAAGGRAGFAHTPADALAIVGGDHACK